MCGITGIHAFNEVGVFYMINNGKATDLLAKRGPDSRGSFVDDYVALGHRRLSIIDTSSNGKQPFQDQSGRYVIIFNGEIFNYKELKQKLTDKGYSFTSESDTEVLLQLYILEKEKCLDQLVGFFAFAVYDKLEQSLFIARDRMGIKPLLYYYDSDKLVFSSEMKSLLAYNIPRKLDRVSLYTFLQLNYIPGPYTIFENIFKLEPGHYISIRNKKPEIKAWYHIPYNRKNMVQETYEEQKEHLKRLMDESVRLRLIADVPLGAFLSGGIDSSVIAALAVKHTEHLNTFSIGYRDEPMFDETNYANLVAKKLGTNHTVFSLTNNDLLNDVYDVLNYIDEPFADSSALPLHILSKHTAKKVKVALSGDGADELFAGYNKHYAEYKIRSGSPLLGLIKAAYSVTKHLPASRNSWFGNKIRQINRLAEGMPLSASERYWRWCCITSGTEANFLLQTGMAEADINNFTSRKKELLQHFSKNGDMNEVLLTDMELDIPYQMMYKADMMSMANGLEVRVPFLDHRVVNYAFRLPVSSKIDRSMRKKIVKDTFRELLPEELYNRPKHGFDVPMLKWFRRELNDLIQNDLLSDKLIEEQGIFAPEKIKNLKKQLQTGTNVDQEQIWALIVFQSFWKKYLQNYQSMEI